MTLVELYFVTPIGDPIINSPVDIQPEKSGFTEEFDGIIMPRAASAVTDAHGKCTVELWPSPVPYYVQCADPLSDAEIFYRFIVPVVPAGTVVRLQDITIENNGYFPGAVFELVSDTVLKIKVRGSDGVTRSTLLALA